MRPLRNRCSDNNGAGGLRVSPGFKQSPKIGGLGWLIETVSAVSSYIGSIVFYKRCPDIVGAGGLGVSPSFPKSPKIGGLGG